MVVSVIADTTEDLIKSLAFFIEIAHYCVVIYGVRKEWDSARARKQPVATYLMSIACCFGGGMLTSIAVGKPAMTPLSNNQSVLMMTIIWWLVFYSPMDAVFALLSWPPVFIIILTMKEMIRTRKIIKGVKLARNVFPGSLLICTFIGMLAACGGGFIKNAACIAREKWDHHSVKQVHFSPITKFSLLFSLLYNLQLLGVLDVSFNTVVFLQFIVMSCVSIDSKFGFHTDPFRPIEMMVTSIVVDYSAFGTAEEEETNEPKKPVQKKHKKED